MPWKDDNNKKFRKWFVMLTVPSDVSICTDNKLQIMYLRVLSTCVMYTVLGRNEKRSTRSEAINFVNDSKVTSIFIPISIFLIRLSPNDGTVKKVVNQAVTARAKTADATMQSIN